MSDVLIVPNANQLNAFTNQNKLALAIQTWLHGRAYLTRESYQRCIEQLTIWMAQQNIDELEHITLPMLQRFVDSLKAQERGDSFVHHTIEVIKAFFSWCMKTGFIKLNPAGALRNHHKGVSLSERILTEEEVNRMLAIDDTPRNKLILQLLFTSGLRASELCDLEWRDVVFRNENKSVLNVRHGKGDKQRSVVINERVANLLRLHKPGEVKPNDSLFGIQRRQLQNVVKSIANQAGLPNVSPHFFRHAHATISLEKGAPISLVQQSLGHSSIATTGRYLHVRPDKGSSQYLE